MANTGKVSTLESHLATLPPDANPFALIANVAMPKLALNHSKSTIGFFKAFLVFHSIVAVICTSTLVASIILRPQHTRWLVKSLYIKDKSGQNVYRSPLYLVNTGILVAFWQLLCSVSSATYIWIQIKSSESVMDQVLHAKIAPTLAAMFVFETLSYGTITHCFFVTFYFSRRFNLQSEKGIMKWISPPIVINSFFAGFAMCTVFPIAGLASWTAINLNRFATTLMKILDLLSEGTGAWNQVHGRLKLSHDEISRLQIHTFEVLFKLKQKSAELGPQIDNFSYASLWCEGWMIAVACINCAIFVPVFCSLVRKYPRASRRGSTNVILPSVDHSSIWLEKEDVGNWGGIKRVSADPTNVRTSRVNKKFVYFLMRSIGILISMMFILITLMIMFIKNRKLIDEKRWRDLTAWIVIVGGAWSAIPTVWQCFRLITDKTNEGLLPLSFRNSSLLPRDPMKNSSQDSQTVEAQQINVQPIIF